MAIANNCSKFLTYAKTLGVSYENTLTLGRMTLYADKEYVASLEQKHQLFTQKTASVSFESGYAEPLFALLGATQLRSLDFSPYENAAIIQDLNQPWPEQYNNEFSAIFDGGTLEHVFNFPVAIKSCMKAIKPGGHFIAITPANNQNGHGFYQFSPELYFRIFSEENGFAIKKLLLTVNDDSWYEVTDPNTAKSRVLFTNSQLTRMMVVAEKIKEVPVFSASPYQSDYSQIWIESEAGTRKSNTTGNSGIKKLLRMLLPAGLKNSLQNIRGVLSGQLKYTSGLGFINPAHFKKVDF